MTKNEIKGQLRRIVKGESRQAIADKVSDFIITAECNANRPHPVYDTRYEITYWGDGKYTLSTRDGQAHFTR